MDRTGAVREYETLSNRHPEVLASASFVVTLISPIRGQTNLLALNATTESESAPGLGLEPDHFVERNRLCAAS